MNKIKVSVIGLAHAANAFHLPGLATFPDIDLSICDIKPERLHEARDRYNIPPEKCYPDYREMLEKENPQAVMVLMAQYAHGDYKPQAYFKIVGEVIRQGRAVMVEKPLAMTAKEALPLVKLVEQSGVVNMCSFNRRFNPLINFCRDLILERGEMLNVNCNFYKGWPSQEVSCGNWLNGDMIHALDLMRYLMKGEITEFYSSIGKNIDPNELTAFHALAKFSGGGTGIFSSNVRVGTRRELFQLHGRGISAYIESDPEGLNPKSLKAAVFADNQREPKIYYDHEISNSVTFQACSGFTYADRHFIDQTKKGKPARCDFRDAYKTLEYCDRILPVSRPGRVSSRKAEMALA
jgi:predicted dehydrogenase